MRGIPLRFALPIRWIDDVIGHSSIASKSASKSRDNSQTWVVAARTGAVSPWNAAMTPRCLSRRSHSRKRLW